MEEIIICECTMIPLMIFAHFIGMIGICLMEWAMEKQWRRKNLKFLSDDDIRVLNHYLESKEEDTLFDIGILVKIAYKKEKELRKTKREWWKNYGKNSINNVRVVCW